MAAQRCDVCSLELIAFGYLLTALVADAGEWGHEATAVVCSPTCGQIAMSDVPQWFTPTAAATVATEEEALPEPDTPA